MRTFVVGLWKEWRDSRGIAIALLIALPVLALSAAWAFGGDVPKPSFGGLSLFVLTVAQALYVLAVASESFGGERRRGTLDFVRRLPRGLGRAFAAKCGAYVLGTLLAIAWGLVVAWTACRLLGPGRAVGDFPSLLLEPDPLTATLALALFVLGLWTLFVSNLIPQGGAATVGAALLLGLLGVPVYLALKDRTWLVRMPSGESLRLGLLVLGALGAAALSVAFLSGCRLLGGIWGPAWRGLAVVLIVAGGGYAWGAAALDRALTIDPHDPDFRIFDQAYLGSGGRYLYVNVYRGPNAWQPAHDVGVEMGTPMQPWIVDRKDGSWRVAGEYFQGWVPAVWNNRQSPQPIVKRYDMQGGEYAWFDATSGELRKVLPVDVRTPDVQSWQRSAMPALAWTKDAEGRALWLEGDRLVREGEDAPYEKWFKGKAESWYEAVEGGWLGNTAVWDKDHRQAHAAWWICDAGSGTTRTIERYGGRVAHELVLSTRTALRRSFADVPRGQKAPLLPWTLVDLAGGGEPQPAVNPPDSVCLEALPGERALVMAGKDKERLVLSSWDPRTGATSPVLDERGRPTVGRNANVLATVPGGLRVVRVVQDHEDWPAATTLLMDDALGHAWRLPVHDVGDEVVAIESPRSVVTIQRGMRVMRYELVQFVGRDPVFGLEVLFPR